MYAFKRALPLAFSCGRINHARCGSVYFEDRMKLEEKNRSIYAEFMKGEFVVQLGSKKFISVAMDEDLEIGYNKRTK